MNQIQQIEQNIREAREIAEVGGALERLRFNKDFKKVIGEGYFEKEAIRLVHLKADPSMQTPERQASILKQIDAIGALTEYCTAVFHRAELARKAMESDESMLDELRNEGELE